MFSVKQSDPCNWWMCTAKLRKQRKWIQASAKDFHHKITDTFPSLVGLEAEGKYLKDTSGVRNVSNVSVYANNELIAKEHGEVQFTKYGVSGIPIFQISHFAIEALRRKKKSKIYLNLMPQMVTFRRNNRSILKELQL